MSASLDTSDIVDVGDDDVLVDFERIYREQATFVLKLFLRLGVSKAQAEDLAQDVFEVLIVKLQNLAPVERQSVSSMRAYLFRITWNVFANHRRLRAHVHERPFEQPPEVESAAQPHELVLAREIARYLSKLTPMQAAVFVGFEVFGMTAPELAEAHCIDEREARRILEDARRTLRRSVNPPQGTD